MKVQTIIHSLPTGLWKDNLAALKKGIEGSLLSRAERKWLENEIQSVQKSGKRERLVKFFRLDHYYSTLIAVAGRIWTGRQA